MRVEPSHGLDRVGQVSDELCGCEDLDVRAEAEQGRGRVGHALQRDRGVPPAVWIGGRESALRQPGGLRTEYVGQGGDPVRGEAYGRDTVDVGLLVTVDMGLPERRQIEAVRSGESLGQRPQVHDRGDAVGAWLAMPGGDQIPDAGFEDETQRVQSPGDLARPGRPAAIAHLDDLVLPECLGDGEQAWHRVGFPVPAGRV